MAKQGNFREAVALVGSAPAIGFRFRVDTDDVWFELVAGGHEAAIFSGIVTTDWPQQLRALADHVDGLLDERAAKAGEARPADAPVLETLLQIRQRHRDEVADLIIAAIRAEGTVAEASELIGMERGQVYRELLDRSIDIRDVHSGLVTCAADARRLVINRRD